MATKEFDKKEIRKTIKNLVQEGKTRAEIMEILLTEYSADDYEEIANILRYIPSKQLKKKYGFLNIIFTILLIGIAYGTYHALKSIWVTIPLLGLLVIVFLKKYRYYGLNAAFGIFLTLVILAFLLFEYNERKLTSERTLELLMGILGCVVQILGGIIIPLKLTPDFDEKRVRYVDETGRPRIKIIPKFND